jgi:hypothetical protein
MLLAEKGPLCLGCLYLATGAFDVDGFAGFGDEGCSRGGDEKGKSTDRRQNICKVHCKGVEEMLVKGIGQ